MASTSRPVRNRTQPSRNRDNVQLNNQVIERYDALQGTKLASTSSTNFAKLLSLFIKSVNDKYNASLLKNEQQRKDQPPLKNKHSDGTEQSEWGPTKEKKKYAVDSSIKGYSKAHLSSKPQQEKPMEKVNNEATKAARNSKAPLPIQKPQQQLQTRIQSKQPRKPNVQPPQPPPARQTPKPFKRASYHIGIAYTIYMDQMKAQHSNLIDLNSCDPTLPSKRLRSSQQQ